LDEKKLAVFSALAGRFLRFPIGDRRCNRTRASVGNAGGNARPSLTNARQLSSGVVPVWACFTMVSVVLRAAERSAILRDCLKQLSSAHRQVVDLVYYHEQSIDEVARIIGVPPNTVK